MSDPNNPTTPPGWYPDGQGGQRYWDGTQWTEHTQPVAATEQPAGESAGDAPGQQYFDNLNVGGGGGGGNRKLLILIGSGLAAVLVAIILLAVVLSALGGGDPESVAKDFVEESLNANVKLDGDHEKLCEMLADDRQEELLDANDSDDCGEYAQERDEEIGDLRDDRVDECEDWEELTDDINWEIEIVEVDENDAGDEATVEYEIHYSFDGDEDKLEDCEGDADEFDETEDGEVDLVKEDGDWKVEDG